MEYVEYSAAVVGREEWAMRWTQTRATAEQDVDRGNADGVYKFHLIERTTQVSAWRPSV